MRKFRKHKVVLEILSDDETFNPEGMSLSQMAQSIEDGPCVGRTYLEGTGVMDLTPKQMADALYEFGSEPGFFQLDRNGNETD